MRLLIATALSWLLLVAPSMADAQPGQCHRITLPFGELQGIAVSTTADAANPASQHFVALSATDIEYAERTSLCLEADNLASTPRVLALRLDNARLEHAELLESHGNGWELLGVAGIDYPLTRWERYSGEIVFERLIEPGEHLMLELRIGTGFGYQGRLYAGDGDAIDTLLFHQQVTAGVLAGMILALILYTLFLAATSKDATYAYLAGSTASATLLQLNELGYLYPLWPHSPGWNQMATVVFAVWSTIFGVAQARSYLLTGQFLPRTDRVLKLFGLYLVCICLPLAFSSNKTLHNVLYLLPAVIFMAVLVYISIVRIRQGYAPAVLYLVAVSLPVIAGFMVAMTYTGQLTPTPLARLAPLAASAVQLIVFALAVGERINWLKAQQMLSRQQALLAETETSAKKNFLAHISHELRTPLAGIIGLAELARKNPLYQQNEPLVNGLENSARHLLDTTNLLLDHARLDAGKWGSAVTVFSPAELLNTLVARFGQPARRKQLSLTVRIQPGTPDKVEADEDIIRRILEQLVDNAIKFTENGGVLITAEFCSEHGPGSLRFDVIDTGKGIDPDFRPRIFELFELADTSTTRSRQGLGLGLSLCRKLCGLLGGEIGCESNAQHGTMFWFRFPCRGAPAPLSAPPAAPEPLPAAAAPVPAIRRDLRWLVAEDDETLQMIIGAQLEKLGIDHALFPHGGPLVERYRQAPADVALVLLDWNMPVCNARQAIAAIRHHEAQYNLPPVRIAVLSAYDKHSAKDVIDLPDDIALLHKPVTEADLVRLLE